MRTPEAVAGMLCPVCKVGLHMSDRQGIEIDYCPQCRGIWLDRGELDKIIERSGADAPQAPPPPQPPVPPQQPYPNPGPWGNDRAYDQRGYYHHKKRKSFLEELFD